MPSRGQLNAHPSDYLAADEPWPRGGLVPDAPPEARLALAVARRLEAQITRRGLSLREAERATGASVSALSNILHGNSWGDLPTIARIERGLNVALWGHEHLR
ncbi:helix-turn-helix domain-containing protein [Candidatus Poriferisodalis sp.]|uniref:helix-turn-helix domain-containing protein n=1 Tax=Candidatus Poriferisodalis sp. TaxID=3101277 RepID=UPI003C7050CA